MIWGISNLGPSDLQLSTMHTDITSIWDFAMLTAQYSIVQHSTYITVDWLSRLYQQSAMTGAGYIGQKC